MDGQLTIFDVLEPERPKQPPFKVNICVWQGNMQCGWCGRPGLLGGFATDHPTVPGFSIYGDYCRACCDKYGDPKISDLELVVNLDPAGNHRGDREQQILETIQRWRETIK